MKKNSTCTRWAEIFLSAVIIMLFCCLCLTVYGDEGGEAIRIQIIHNNPCESCNEEERLTELVRTLKPKEGAGADYKLEIYYAYQQDGRDMLLQMLERFELEESSIFFPFLVIGDRYLSGEKQIEEHLTEYMSQASDGKTDGVNGTASSQETEETVPEDKIPYLGEETIQLVYFHTANCSSCEEADRYLNALPDSMEVEGKEYPIVITKLSLADPENTEIFYQMSKRTGVDEKDRKVPLLFLGEQYLSGKDRICEDTEELLKAGAGLGADYRMENGETEDEPEYQSHPVRAVMEAAGAGFLNGFNPCALSMVLLFFSLIASLKKGFLRNGLLFLFGKLAAYILLGMLIANAFSLVPFTLFGAMKKVINLILILICLVLAAGNFSDAYHAYKGEYGKIRVQLPVRIRRWNHKLIRGFTGLEESTAFPTIIVLGSMVISLGEFLCTGQIYLASILRWVQVDGGYIPVVLFVVYASAMCLPALLILLLIHRGKSVLSFTDLSLQKMPVIKLLNGILFLLFFLWAVCNF